MLTITALLAVVVGQQGVGGFGGGGVQGRFGVEQLGSEERFEHILTPGDKTEWPFELKRGEVMILRAESTVFDPAIEVVDSDGNKVAENDDEEPGKQNARLLVYAEKPGTYTAHVKNYRSTSGGQYSFFVRRYESTQLVPGSPVPVQYSPQKIQLFAVMMKTNDVAAISGGVVPDIIFGPDAFRRVSIISGVAGFSFAPPIVVRADRDGPYFFGGYSMPTIEGSQIQPMSVRFANVHKVTSDNLNLRSTIEPRSVEVLEVTTRELEFLSLDVESEARVEVLDMDAALRAPVVLDVRRREESRNVVKRLGIKRQNHTAIMYGDAGVHTLYILNSGFAAHSYSIASSKAWREWDPRTPIEDRLQIGETRYYRFTANPQDTMTFAASSGEFDVRIELFDIRLKSLQVSDDWRDSTDGWISHMFTSKGPYYIAVNCFGDGGGGRFKLVAATAEVRPIGMGRPQTVTVTSALDALFSFDAAEPGPYSLRVKGKNGSWTTVIKPDGSSLTAQKVTYRTDDSLIVFTIPEPGRYRVRLPAVQPAATFTLLLQRIDD